MEKTKLFCLPYAGGSAMVYTQWKKHLHSMIDLRPVELAGRGKKYNLPFYGTFEDAVDDVYNSIKNELDGSPYALFGHSMGSLLAYELCYKIREHRHREPVHIFFSGRYPPHIFKDDKVLHTLPDKEFMDEIIKYGGTPQEVLEHKELLNIFIPILKADYKILETHKDIPQDLVFDHDITVLYGNEDIEVTAEDAQGWKEYTRKQCDIHEFEGGHFFINDESVSITSIINNVLVDIW